MTRQAFVSKVNDLAQRAIPFFFLTDFELEQLQVWPLASLASQGIYYCFEGATNHPGGVQRLIEAERIPPGFDEYEKKFQFVKMHLQAGNSFLVNLTAASDLLTRASLADIFLAAYAKYKILYQNSWVVFSPETFVQISDNKIVTCPMKGTIDASLPDARQLLLASEKELAEHVTVVDLLRNDLSRFCSQVHVERFRYVEHLATRHKNLLQTSSKIVGTLPAGYRSVLGDILLSLLPAGSVCGAPKMKTCEIIREAEGEKRGYYTGVAGLYNGHELNSCVLIRFVEKNDKGLIYRSGGGITAQSNPHREYEELINKVYVPTAGVHQHY